MRIISKQMSVSRGSIRRRGGGIRLLHRKCVFTLCLLLFAESIALSNAAKFWSAYDGWSRQFFGGKNHYREDECRDDDTCKSLKTNPFHPRSRARIPATMITTAAASKAIPDCCAKECASCVLKVRGGEQQSFGTESTLSTVASAAVTPYGLPLNLWKVIFQFFLTAMNVACWLIPLKSKKMTENKLALSLANAFSGGVFLTLAFGHLIPECVHGFQGVTSNEALPYMIVLGGYLLIFFVEKVAFDAHGLMHTSSDENHGSKNEEDNDSPSLGAGRSAVILLGALAVHSILEMTALGLADTFADSAVLSLSIALHQVCYIFCNPKYSISISFFIDLICLFVCI